MTRVLFGTEIEVSPMAAIKGIYVQNGNPNCKAELIASLIMKSGIYKFKTLEATDQKASLLTLT